MNTEPDEMVIELLGPLSVHLNRTPVMPSAAKPRQILALLALNAGRVVTVSMLAEEIWGDYPPRSAATTLQTYILQIRNLIAAAVAPGADPKQVLSTRHCGYLLGSHTSQNDVHEFGRLSRAGRVAAETGDYRAASDLLGRALALWGGPALVDVRMGRVLELEVTALEENRLGVLERRIESDLALDRHADILGELTTLAARYPMNENFCGHLMTALYRAGHVGRALEAFQRLRAALRDELGVDPCPRLRRLQQAVLAGDPALDTAEAARRAAHGRVARRHPVGT
ncbi:MAG TPA: AfsR/SARP family transcriptional regulator [Streptosporangiaceae bacterium]|nr:AfsR/SARP family transcriptional regulator [Streptosporangiaceae bacterium]